MDSCTVGARSIRAHHLLDHRRYIFTIDRLGLFPHVDKLAAIEVPLATGIVDWTIPILVAIAAIKHATVPALREGAAVEEAVADPAIAVVVDAAEGIEHTGTDILHAALGTLFEVADVTNFAIFVVPTASINALCVLALKLELVTLAIAAGLRLVVANAPAAAASGRAARTPVGGGPARGGAAFGPAGATGRAGMTCGSTGGTPCGAASRAPGGDRTTRRFSSTRTTCRFGSPFGSWRSSAALTIALPRIASVSDAFFPATTVDAVQEIGIVHSFAFGCCRVDGRVEDDAFVAGHDVLLGGCRCCSDQEEDGFGEEIHSVNIMFG